MLPYLADVRGRPTDDSQTITVSWSLPDQDCFNFTSFDVSCTPIEGETQTTQSDQNTAGSGVSYARVRPLRPNTLHNCSVESSFDGFTMTTRTYASDAVFTFPPSKLCLIRVNMSWGCTDGRCVLQILQCSCLDCLVTFNVCVYSDIELLLVCGTLSTCMYVCVYVCNSTEPEAPKTPQQSQDVKPTANTITVRFTLPQNNQNIRLVQRIQ